MADSPSSWHIFLEHSCVHNRMPLFSRGCLLPRAERTDVQWLWAMCGWVLLEGFPVWWRLANRSITWLVADDNDHTSFNATQCYYRNQYFNLFECKPGNRLRLIPPAESPTPMYLKSSAKLHLSSHSGKVNTVARAENQEQSVFSFLRQPTTWHCPHLPLHTMLWHGCHRALAACTAVNWYLLPAGPTAANPTQRWVTAAQWDRRTDKRQMDEQMIEAMPDSSIHPALHTMLFCSLAVLDPRVGHTMDVLSPFISLLLSFWLTLSQGVLSMSWCCPSRLCVVFLACVHLALFLASSLSPGNTPLFPHVVTIASLLWQCLAVPSLLQLS